jgi:hypothetical protein
VHAVFAAGRKLRLAVATLLALQAFAPGAWLAQWGSVWMQNRSRILTLSAINVGITTVSEAASRSMAVAIAGSDARPDTAFFVSERPGLRAINRQSLINILMTLFASLAAAPAMFLVRRRHRFLFFLGFGLMSSYVSQIVAALFLKAPLVHLGRRLLFDFGYLVAVKFLAFELFRGGLVHRDRRFFRLVLSRAQQDGVTTFLRVSLLNLLGFRG